MRSKKLFLAVATLTSLTLLAAACGGSSDSSARTKNAALDSTTILATATSPTSISNATSMAPSTTMAVAPTTSVNPLACPITAVRTGGTGNSIPIRVTICRPLTNLQVSYWLGTNRLTYSVLLNVPNSTTYEFHDNSVDSADAACADHNFRAGHDPASADAPANHNSSAHHVNHAAADLRNFMGRSHADCMQAFPRIAVPILRH